MPSGTHMPRAWLPWSHLQVIFLIFASVDRSSASLLPAGQDKEVFVHASWTWFTIGRLGFRRFLKHFRFLVPDNGLKGTLWNSYLQNGVALQIQYWLEGCSQENVSGIVNGRCFNSRPWLWMLTFTPSINRVIWQVGQQGAMLLGQNCLCHPASNPPLNDTGVPFRWYSEGLTIEKMLHTTQMECIFWSWSFDSERNEIIPSCHLKLIV